jgi:hypothetical protein
MKMKCSKGFIMTVAALLIVGLSLWHRWNEMANEPAMTRGDGGSIYLRKEMLKYQQRAATNRPAPPQSSNEAPRNLGSNY